jgi:hypothetical protein
MSLKWLATLIKWIRPASSVAASTAAGAATGAALGGIPQAIGAVGTAVGEVAHAVSQRDSINNAPDIVANREAAAEQKEHEKNVKAVANALKTGDPSEVQKRGSI